MENPNENFIPPFTPVQQPRQKKPVGLIVSVVLLVLVALGLGTAFYLEMTQAKDLQRQVDDLKGSAVKMDEQMAADMHNMESAADYREIPELGVKYKLTDQTKDLTYQYVAGADDTMGMVRFSTVELSKLKDAKGKTVCTSAEAPSGMMTRYSGEDTPKSLDAYPEKTTKQVGDNNLVYLPPQDKTATCKGDAKSDVLQKSIDAVKAAYDSLEAM